MSERPQEPSSDTAPSSAGIEPLLADQRQRWEQGERVLVEIYLERNPDLRAAPELLLDLIYHEVLCRVRRGETPPLTEYQERFPALASELAAQFSLERALQSAERAGLETTLSGRDVASLRAVDLTRSARAPAEDETITAPAPAPAAPVRRLEERIGRYRIERVLGEGAFGTVYLGHDDELRRLVAIKVPRPSRVFSAGDIEAYLAEARLVATLDHPHIVPVYDAGRTPDGRCYVVSKLIPGQDLARRLTFGPLPAPEAVTILVQLAEALDHAHERGLVHRDIKPANILLDPLHQAYLADFGLALQTAEPPTEVQLAGTPAYMSPEQASGAARLDARSDLFSLAVVFYEMLTGSRPFQGRTWEQLRQQIMRAEPSPPRVLDRTIPDGLSTLCTQGLAKRPADRWADARTLAVALRRWQREFSSRAPAPTVEGSVRHPLRPRGGPFELEDGPFYLNLCPGLRGGDYLPAAIRFWKNLLEATDLAQACGAGVLAGPPGSGKSSLVRAGVLPRLVDSVHPILVTIESADPEGALRTALRQHLGDVPEELPLPDMVRRLRDEKARRRKIVLILDQVERWWLGGAAPDTLAAALAVCDGHRLQCWLITRDDFLEQTAALATGAGFACEAGKNLAIMDPFDEKEGCRVLEQLGQALCRLPADADEMTFQQTRFLLQSVAGLAVGGKVMAVRLAQLADTFKDRPWRLAVLGQMGGVTGVIATLLEESFPPPQAEARDEALYRGAREVLARLLPSAGEAKTLPVRSVAVLREAVGGPDSAATVARVLGVLDEQLRFVVPARMPAAADADLAQRWGYRLLEERLAVGVQGWLQLNPDHVPARQSRARRTVGASRAATGTDIAGAPRFSSSYRGYRRFPSAVALLLLMTAGIGWCLISPFASRFFRKGGELVVQAADRHGTIVVLQKGAQIQTLDTSSTSQITLAPGTYELELAPGQPELRLSTRQVTLGSGGREVVTLRVERPPPPPPAPPKQRPVRPRPDQVVKPAPMKDQERRFRAGSYVVPKVAVAPDGSSVLAASEDGTVRLWDLATGRELQSLRGHRGIVLDAVFSPDGKQAVSGGEDKTVRVWDLEEGRERRHLEGHQDWIMSVAFCPDGRHVLSAGGGNAGNGGRSGTDLSARLWDLESGAELRRFEGHTEFIWSVACSPDGSQVATASVDRTVRLWDIDTGKESQRLLHPDRCLAVAYSPDGNRLLVACQDRLVYLWDARTGKQEACLKGHAQHVISAAFSPDGLRGLSSSWDDRSVRLWDLATAQELRCFRISPDWPTRAAFTPDGRAAVVGSSDGTIRVLNLP